MRGCSTLPTNLLHGWPVMGTPNRSTSKRLIPPSRSAGRATIASRDRHSSTLIAHRPNQHHPRISDASIDAHRLMLKFQIFLASNSRLFEVLASQAPTKYEQVVNLKTAKMLGL